MRCYYTPPEAVCQQQISTASVPPVFPFGGTERGVSFSPHPEEADGRPETKHTKQNAADRRHTMHRLAGGAAADVLKCICVLWFCSP